MKTIRNLFLGLFFLAVLYLLFCNAGSAQQVLRVSGGGGGTTGAAGPAGPGAVSTTVTYSATPTFTVLASTIQEFKLTLTGNVTSSTLVTTLAAVGQEVAYRICLDGTSSRTFVPPTNVLGMGTVGGTASACYIQSFSWDGTNANAKGPMVCPLCPPAVVIPGSSSGASTLLAPATGGGTVTFPAGTGTLGYVIASGTATLGTSAIAANACATVVTVTATGTAATDVVSWTPNADISGVTGYGKEATDGLIIYPYPTTNNVNFHVCNATGTSITPGAATLNWRVPR